MDVVCTIKDLGFIFFIFHVNFTGRQISTINNSFPNKLLKTQKTSLKTNYTKPKSSFPNKLHKTQKLVSKQITQIPSKVHHKNNNNNNNKQTKNLTVLKYLNTNLTNNVVEHVANSIQILTAHEGNGEKLLSPR